MLQIRTIHLGIYREVKKRSWGPGNSRHRFWNFIVRFWNPEGGWGCFEVRVMSKARIDLNIVFYTKGVSSWLHANLFGIAGHA